MSEDVPPPPVEPEKEEKKKNRLAILFSPIERITRPHKSKNKRLTA